MASEKSQSKGRNDGTPQAVVCCASGEELNEAIKLALTDREQVVMVRVNEQLLDHLDMLVDSGICQSRSSAATFMLREGIEANKPLFERIAGVAEQIAELRSQLQDLVQEPADEDRGP